MLTRIDVYVALLVLGLMLTMAFIAICAIKLFVRGKNEDDDDTEEQDEEDKK